MATQDRRDYRFSYHGRKQGIRTNEIAASENISTPEITVNWHKIYCGNIVQRATLVTNIPLAPLGSLFVSTDRMYLKIANNWVDADWQKVNVLDQD